MHGMISSLTVVELSIMISRQETCVREDGIPVNIEWDGRYRNACDECQPCRTARGDADPRSLKVEGSLHLVTCFRRAGGTWRRVEVAIGCTRARLPIRCSMTLGLEILHHDGAHGRQFSFHRPIEFRDLSLVHRFFPAQFPTRECCAAVLTPDRSRPVCPLQEQ